MKLNYMQKIAINLSAILSLFLFFTSHSLACDSFPKLVYFSFDSNSETPHLRWVEISGDGRSSNTLMPRPYQLITIKCDADGYSHFLAQHSQKDGRYIGFDYDSSSDPHPIEFVDPGDNKSAVFVGMFNDNQTIDIRHVYALGNISYLTKPIFNSSNVDSGLMGFFNIVSKATLNEAITIAHTFAYNDSVMLERLYTNNVITNFLMENNNNQGQMRFADRSDFNYGPHGFVIVGANKYRWVFSPFDSQPPSQFKSCEPNPSDANVVYCKHDADTARSIFSFHEDLSETNSFLLRSEYYQKYMSYRGACRSDSCVTFSENSKEFAWNVIKPAGYSTYFVGNIDEKAKFYESIFNTLD